MKMPNRYGSDASSKYAFGYQGSRMDDEIYAQEGSAYTTFYRGLDVRTARWYSVDPVTDHWQSPYTSMDNNPIFNNDILGDDVDGDEEAMEQYDESKKMAKNKILEKSKQIDEMNNKIKSGTKFGNWIKGRNRKLKSMKNTKADFESYLKETKDLEDSDVVYWLNSKFKATEKIAGFLGYDKNNERVTVNYSSGEIHFLAHELKHAYQYEVGKMALVAVGKGEGLIPYYDRMDEVEAYNRQSSFQTGTVGNMSTYDNFLEQERYRGLGHTQISLSDSDNAKQLLTNYWHHFTLYGKTDKVGKNVRYKGWETDKSNTIKKVKSLMKNK